MRQGLPNAGLFLALVLLGCGPPAIPKGPPCIFDPANFTAGWRRIELPWGTFEAPADLPLEPVVISTFEGSSYSFSAPGISVRVGSSSSIIVTDEVLCSERRWDHWLVIWHHFEESRARDFGYHFWAYLIPQTGFGQPDFGLKVWVEDERRIADAERIASSIRLP